MNHFRKFINESPVGAVGRTGQSDALNYITPELKNEFFKLVKMLGGKTVARELINSLRSDTTPLKKDGDATLNVTESELSPLQQEYNDYFAALLKKYKASSPADMDDETMGKFFDDVKSGWTKGEGKK